jgi:sugar phosphate isomerase/epimerase
MKHASSLPLAYSTNGFTERSLPEALKIISDTGYHGVELLGDRPHWSAEGGAELSAPSLRRLLSDLGLNITNINGNTAMFCWPSWMPDTLFEPSLNHRDAVVRQRRIDIVYALLDWAAELNAPRVSITSGRIPGLSRPEEERARLAESLHILCERAQQLGLQLSIEYEPGLLIERWTEVRDLLDFVDHPALGANLDLGHARCAGEDPDEAIRGLAGRIWNIHIEDILGSKHYHLVPGDGDMNLSKHLKTLTEIGYEGALTVELYTYANAERGGDLIAAQRAFEALVSIKSALN